MLISSRTSTILRRVALVVITSALSASAAPTINKVESHFFSAAEAESTRHYNRVGLSKFDGLESPDGKQVFFVHWDPGTATVPKGSRLVFEYYQSRFNRVQALQISYPFEIINARKATFTVADKAFRKGGPVTRWRVSLMEGNRILAQQKSAAWKP